MTNNSEIIEKIGKLVEWYNSNCKSATPVQLLDCKDLLVTFNYNLAEQVADMTKDYHKSYYIRKMAIAVKKNAYIKNGEAIGKAESLATEDAAEQFESELEYEAMALRFELLLKQSNKVVDALQQRISYLKVELNRGT